MSLCCVFHKLGERVTRVFSSRFGLVCATRVFHNLDVARVHSHDTHLPVELQPGLRSLLLSAGGALPQMHCALCLHCSEPSNALCATVHSSELANV